MTKRTNIVSFEEAKKASRSNHAENRTDNRSKSRSTRAPRAEKRADGRTRRRAAGSDESQDASSKRRRSSRSAGQPKRTASKQAAASEAREQKRRNRTKARASKLFDKQFGSESARSGEAAQAEGSPRAALYEGQMGASHKRAARMQRATEAEPVSAKINPAGWFSNLNVSPRSLKVGTAVLCLVLTAVFLYVPAQQYYQSVREHDRLQAEYAVLEQRNKALDEQNNVLASDAGMEDAVRQKYGYVVKGDQTAIVTGLSDQTLDTSRDSENIEANVLASSVEAPEEWYTPYLDAFFGVS